MPRKESLQEILQKAGKEVGELLLADGGRALLLTHGGRILGLYPSGSDENFFWTHSSINSVQSALEFYTSSNWPNSGGDRTWLAPERELFIRDLTHPWETYQVPRSLDPGDYVLRKENGLLLLASRMSVALLQSGITANVEITKSISPTPNPLNPVPLLRGSLQYAGYTLRTSLLFESNACSEGVQLGIWNLLQLRHGGNLFISTIGCVKPAELFGQVDSVDLLAQDGVLQYRMRADGTQKIGLYSSSILGRAGYVYRHNEATEDLIVRDFQVDPLGCYADVPWGNPQGRGYCFQACNVNSSLGQFSELEHHAPALNSRTGYPAPACMDVSRTWAFRGPPDAIKEAAGYLLFGLIGST